MYLYSTSTKLSIDVWLYLDRPGSLNFFAAEQSSKITFKDAKCLLLAICLYTYTACYVCVW